MDLLSQPQCQVSNQVKSPLCSAILDLTILPVGIHSLVSVDHVISLSSLS